MNNFLENYNCILQMENEQLVQLLLRITVQNQGAQAISNTIVGIQNAIFSMEHQLTDLYVIIQGYLEDVQATTQEANQRVIEVERGNQLPPYRNIQTSQRSLNQGSIHDLHPQEIPLPITPQAQLLRAVTPIPIQPPPPVSRILFRRQ